MTELLFELHRGAAVVATSDLSDYPEEAKSIPRLGPLFMPSIERAVRYRPDWVVVDDSLPVPLFEKGALTLSLPVFRFRADNVQQLFSEAERLLATVFRERDDGTLAKARRCWESRTTSAASEPFLAFVWLQPPILFGARTFLSDVLAARGGTNLLPARWHVPYPQVAEEWLLRRPPKTIYVLDDTPEAERTARNASERWWPGAALRPVVLSRHRFARTTLATALEGTSCAR